MSHKSAVCAQIFPRNSIRREAYFCKSTECKVTDVLSYFSRSITNTDRWNSSEAYLQIPNHPKPEEKVVGARVFTESMLRSWGVANFERQQISAQILGRQENLAQIFESQELSADETRLSKGHQATQVWEVGLFVTFPWPIHAAMTVPLTCRFK